MSDALKTLQVLSNIRSQQQMGKYREWQQKKAEEEFTNTQQRVGAESDINTYLPRLIDANQGNRTEFLRDYGEFLSGTPGAGLEDLEYGTELYDTLLGEANSENSAYNALLRAYGSEAPFLVQTYGGGEVPTTEADLERMTIAAAADPNFSDKRQEWSNIRTSGRFKDLGPLADNPNLRGTYDPKRNVQTVVEEGVGDTIDRQLSAPTTEQTKALSEYRNLDTSIQSIMDEFNNAFVGPLQGNLSNLKSKFSNTPKYTSFKNKVQELRTIIYGLSGKQINETEQKWLDSILPKDYNPDENFVAKMDAIQDWLRDRQAAELIELRNSRRFTSTRPLDETDPKGRVGGAAVNSGGGADSPKRIRIKVQ